MNLQEQNLQNENLDNIDTSKNVEDLNIVNNSNYKGLNAVLQFEKYMLEQYGKKIEKLNFKAGDTIKITEKNGARLQMFEGVVIAIVNKSSRTTVTIRKVDIEKKFTIFSPDITKIEVIKRGIVRRAKLYYLRKLSGKKAKIKERLV
ncbi:MAG: 50S ribosomal protein L19 [Rickettsiales bacterium]